MKTRLAKFKFIMILIGPEIALVSIVELLLYMYPAYASQIALVEGLAIPLCAIYGVWVGKTYLRDGTKR